MQTQKSGQVEDKVGDWYAATVFRMNIDIGLIIGTYLALGTAIINDTVAIVVLVILAIFWCKGINTTIPIMTIGSTKHCALKAIPIEITV